MTSNEPEVNRAHPRGSPTEDNGQCTIAVAVGRPTAIEVVTLPRDPAQRNLDADLGDVRFYRMGGIETT